jgi:hypothetical protein
MANIAVVDSLRGVWRRRWEAYVTALDGDRVDREMEPNPVGFYCFNADRLSDEEALAELRQAMIDAHCREIARLYTQVSQLQLSIAALLALPLADLENDGQLAALSFEACLDKSFSRTTGCSNQPENDDQLPERAENEQ